MDGQRSDAMPRRPAPVVLRDDASRGVLRRTIALDVITPLFGGGVHVDSDENRRQLKRPDPVTAVRGASIRGQLRFWWRATRGCQCDSIDEMRALESLLWGAASSPGRIALAVRGRLSTREEPVFEISNRTGRASALGHRRSVAYAAFPLQPSAPKSKSTDDRPTRLEPGVLHWVQGRPSVDVIFDRGAMASDEAEREWHAIERAIDAWLMFGGLGGRTRRGFGAVDGGVPCDPVAWLNDWQDGARKLPGVPSLAGAELRVMGRRFPNAMQALSAGLARLQAFRQGPGIGRNPGQQPNRPGRSRWPEPELIRELTRQSDPMHRQRLVGVDKAPRAAFGLPIIFHFKGGGEPGDTTLTPEGAQRRASPLIVRPYRLDNGSFDVMALVLRGDQPERLALAGQGGPRDGFAVDPRLTDAEARRIRPLDGNPDVLGAFLDFFASTD